MKLSAASKEARALALRREMRKLREIAHFLLFGQVCFFCRKPLSPTADAWTEHGDSAGPRFMDRLTIHHVDGNHDNNAHGNKVLTHRVCHKRFHMQERHAARKAALCT